MKDDFTKQWIIDNAVEIVDRYQDGVLTLRALHYQLVAIGMTNSVRHYKRVVTSMIYARWNNLIAFEKFSDLDREMVGETDCEQTDVYESIASAKESIEFWLNYYRKNRWENQPYYPEVFIEKKALQGVFQPICSDYDIALGACKGYPSLTFINEATKRFKHAEFLGKIPVILYFGDYDPSGEDIPRSIEANIKKLGCNAIEVRRFALMEHQVIEWGLPSAPAKEGDSRTKNWDGLGQVELDAVKPEVLSNLCEHAISSVFDNDLFNELKQIEKSEEETYVRNLKQFIQSKN